MGSYMPHGQFRIVAWRTNGVRVECKRCGLRFSLNEEQVFEIVDSWPLDQSDHGYQRGGALLTWRRDLSNDEQVQYAAALKE
jgi:transcription elongation factor Elf1